MPPLSLMIKPASGKCNLRCRYCFYHDVAENRETPDKGNMSLSLLETTLIKAFKYADGNQMLVNFQGGEPLLAGKGFMRAAINMINRLNVKKSPVYLGIQTNGTLIDDEWCGIFAENRFLVGLSLDGDETANENRVDADGNPTFDKVLNAATLLKKHGVQFNILSVITAKNAMRVDKIYNFFKSKGFNQIQFIPCLKPLSGDTADDGFYLDGKSYGAFLLTAFALYQNDMKNGRYVSIRQFDNFVKLARFEQAEQCGMNGHCTHQFVVEADGSVYPCDFYCTDDYYLGNISTDDFSSLEHSPRAVAFIRESLEIPEQCKKCEFYMMCKGGCKRERRDLDKCTAYKTFFRLALPYLKRMY